MNLPYHRILTISNSAQVAGRAWPPRARIAPNAPGSALGPPLEQTDGEKHKWSAMDLYIDHLKKIEGPWKKRNFKTVKPRISDEILSCTTNKLIKDCYILTCTTNHHLDCKLTRKRPAMMSKKAAISSKLKNVRLKSQSDWIALGPGWTFSDPDDLR